jgi:hypothetical protein
MNADLLSLATIISTLTISDEQRGVLQAMIARLTPAQQQPARPSNRTAIKATRQKELQEPTGTKIYRSCGESEYEATWNKEAKTLTWLTRTYTSLSTWAIAVAEAHFADGKKRRVNGWTVCYIKKDGKNIKLDKLTNTTPNLIVTIPAPAPIQPEELEEAEEEDDESVASEESEESDSESEASSVASEESEHEDGDESEHFCDVHGHENIRLLHDGQGGWKCPECDAEPDSEEEAEEEAPAPEAPKDYLKLWQTWFDAQEKAVKGRASGCLFRRRTALKKQHGENLSKEIEELARKDCLKAMTGRDW